MALICQGATRTAASAGGLASLSFPNDIEYYQRKDSQKHKTNQNRRKIR
jgi:hypothetical protein